MRDMDDEAEEPVHQPGTRRGEEMEREDGQEEGLYDVEPTGAGRPAGMSTPRASTGVNAEDMDPIDPESPYLQPA